MGEGRGGKRGVVGGDVMFNDARACYGQVRVVGKVCSVPRVKLFFLGM